MKSESGYRVIESGQSFSLREVLSGTSLAISPGPGATATGEYSISAVGNFVPCEFGPLTKRYVTTIYGSCAELKITATGGTVTVEWGAER